MRGSMKTGQLCCQEELPFEPTPVGLQQKSRRLGMSPPATAGGRGRRRALGSLTAIDPAGYAWSRSS